MRILGVRFKNLNSLTGEWQVDFTHPAYASDGIFAITGPTGAGKTTIMDAICLALYGSTPRLGKVTKGGNEIMSRQTGECFAEVTFETGKGRYRCHWSQHRARRKPEGELQQARHEISDTDTGRVLESKINQVGDFIEETTGMNFERFTRSMLLAQGGFAVFLQAPPGERSPLLEQITGTEIYTQISMKVHERRAAERGRLELLQAELKGIQVLGEEEEADLRTGLMEKQKREAELAEERKAKGGALAWIEGMDALERELGELAAGLHELEERRRAFAPESRRLEKSRRALGLEGDYRGLAALRELQASEMKELQDALAVLPEKEKSAEQILAARKKSEGMLQEARARQLTEGETIKSVRDLDTRISERERRLKEGERSIERSETRRKDDCRRLENAEGELKKEQAALEAIRSYQEKHAVDAALTGSLGAIERGFSTLRDAAARHEKASTELKEAAGKRDVAASTCAEREAEHEKVLGDFEKRRKALDGLRDETAAILQGRDVALWRAEAEALKERERFLGRAGETLDRIEQTVEVLGGLGSNLEALSADDVRLMEEIKSVAERKALLEKDVAFLDMQVSLLSRIRDLEEERKRLEDGKPCPLCGATEHPYAGGNVPAMNETEAALHKSREALGKEDIHLKKLENDRIRTSADIRHAQKDLDEKKATLRADEKQLAAVLEQLDIAALPEERAGKIRVEIAGVQRKLAETTGIVSLADRKDGQEKSTLKTLEKIRATFEASGKALQEARQNLETARRDCERLDEDCTALAAQLENARASVLGDVEPFGVGRVPLDGLDALLEHLTDRRNTWQAKEGESVHCERKIVEQKAGIEKQRALLQNLENDLAERRRERDGLKGEWESLKGSRRALFGEKSADLEERRLAETVDRAGKVLETARADYGRIEREIGALKERIASLREKTGHRSAEQVKAEQKWRERITGAGFAGEEDYLSSRLGEEQRESLAAREQALLGEKAELEARRKDRAETLAAERGKDLADQSAETLRENIRIMEADLKQLTLDIGGVMKSLSDNEKQKRSQHERTKRIEAQRKECERWDRLHQLIGSADGKKFRNFAQGLTFEMVIAQANRRLREMTDRYLLLRDEAEPLELNVIDNYQAGEVRSTKNLSGGESFIVSLALALGLSQMAGRNVRVDSLFLDEGFGTLDEDALETALETLAGLRQEGKLIGVISHVSALKERIAARIQVTPETGGRSILSGPGCRRI
ncbi:MAG: AAA family ATPase [Deltaproteobacteria bacterium]|nr:AAA family ATPase [Deltaproteobacteria bacterium]